ncbi:hypothetical protein HHK36_009525 [Tetracentron sinense]|uniref:SAM-dependent MTase RsmB/NOP-type domain-containing protein n=1 Tax=Tetracentron sinense TaxID=13715 RepID=A0A834ZCZ5_TETSI|nr:hypothetical protein HHK36_009525 [Tetracentron sinense]
MGGGGRGGQKRGRTQRRQFRESRENVWKKSRSDNPSSNNNSTWEPFATQNLAFELYYKEQGIVSEEEWDDFMKVLRKPLPAAFRINSSGQFFKDIRLQLENDFMKSLEAEAPDGGEVEAIRPLPWYPENLAWHLNFSRMQLRKNQTLERFHEFLKQENEIGNITRQEAVSMVPPLFLDVYPDHFVLDMCAAPGSKTFQLLEIIHQSTEPGSLPSGMVIANDVDVQRCNLLIHQTKRMCSANLIVTNHEAQHFPGCHLNKSCLDASEMGSAKEQSISELLFDRVLCDVPCSGDGTLRKAPDIWRKWNPGMGNGLHRLQVQIAIRGMSLLKVGGRMVYSTCSMNPVENEAVVAEVLQRCGGSVELLDVSSELPQLVRRPGLKKWKRSCKAIPENTAMFSMYAIVSISRQEGEEELTSLFHTCAAPAVVRDKSIWLASYKDVPRYRRGGIMPSMFPSGRSCEVEKTVSDSLQEDMVPPGDDNEMGSPASLEKGYKNGSNVDSENKFCQSENLGTPTDVLDEEVSSLPLERCIRILPHDQNSGAFFIAVLHKLSSLPAVLENPISKQRFSTSRDHEAPVKLQDEIIEDTNSLEINPSEDDNNHQYSEAASDLLDKQPDGLVEPDSCGICEEDNVPEEAQVHGDGETGPEKGQGKRRLQIQGKWRGVDPVVVFRDEATIDSIKAFYGIDESFLFSGHLVTRNSDTNRVKRIYYISKSVKDVLKLNFLAGQQLKITSIGLKTFERQSSKEGTSSPCAFRISSEGLPLLLPYISKQILCASLADFKHLLQYRTIKFADFVDGEFGEKASNLLLGCCVVVLNTGGQAVSDPIRVDASTIAIGCWKGRTNLTVMVSAMDSQELLERLAVRLGSESSSMQENKPTAVEADAVQDVNDVLVKQDLETVEEATAV